MAQGFWFNIGFESSAYAQVNADGSVPLVLGSTDIGGTRASIAMQLAETLGISAEEVRPHVVDTNSVGYTQVTGGSRTTFAGGWAAYECAQDIRRQMAARAAQIWEVDADAVEYGDDAVIRGPADDDGNEQSMTFKELAASCPPAAVTSSAAPTSTRPPPAPPSLPTSSMSKLTRTRARSTSCATPPSRTWARRFTRRTWRVRCRAAPHRASAWR